MYNEQIDKFLEDNKDSNYHTLKSFNARLKHLRDKNKEEVIEQLKSLEKVKISSRKVQKSVYKKFFQSINDTEMLDVLDSISNEEVSRSTEIYFFDAKQVKEYVDSIDMPPAKRPRMYIYAFLLFLGINREYIRLLSVNDYNEEKNIIKYKDDIYDVSEMDTNNIIKNELTQNKYAKAIDMEACTYTTLTGGRTAKSLKGDLFLRTTHSIDGGAITHSMIPMEGYRSIAQSGAFIRLYNLKKRTGLDSASLYSSLKNDVMRSIKREVFLSDYIEFEKAYEKIKG